MTPEEITTALHHPEIYDVSSGNDDTWNFRSKASLYKISKSGEMYRLEPTGQKNLTMWFTEFTTGPDYMQFMVHGYAVAEIKLQRKLDRKDWGPKYRKDYLHG